MGAYRVASVGMAHEKPMTLWMTGLSASGKSTLAFGMEKKLLEAGRAVFLDGDRLRNGLSRDLGFSPESRRENIRRVAEVARMMNDAGLVVLVSLISPMRADREMAWEIIGDRFLEVFVKAPLEVCVARDPKGLYKKALSGMIPEFTGVSAPYEEPERPDLVLETDSGTSEAVLGQLWDWFGRRIFSSWCPGNDLSRVVCGRERTNHSSEVNNVR